MRRTALVVRPAERGDLPTLLAMYDEMREAVRFRAGRTPEQLRAAAEARYVAAMSDPDARLLVAADGTDGEILGMAFLVLSPLSSLLDSPTVTVAQLHVAPGARRRGAGHALIGAATQWAEDCGSETVSVNVAPQTRDTARFFARLGFAPMVVRRVAPVASLRRRLTPEALAPVLPAAVSDSRLAGDRRGMRARLVTARAHASARRPA